MQVRPGQAAPSFRLMSSTQESDAEFDARWLLFTTLSEFQVCKLSLSGTLPTSTEQTLMAGRSGRFVLLLTTNFARHLLLNFAILRAIWECLLPSQESIFVVAILCNQGMGDLCAMDLVPEPPIIASALRACRRVNDFSLTTRFANLSNTPWGK